MNKTESKVRGMAFKRFATAEDFCETCSPYKVGDTVTLIRDISLEEGVLEAGSIVTITGVRLREGVILPHTYAEEVENYKASEECFEYALEFEEKKIDDFWFSRIFEKGILTKTEILDAVVRKNKAEALMEKATRKIFIPAYLGVFVVIAIVPSLLGCLITVSEKLSGIDAMGLWTGVMILSLIISYFPYATLSEWAWGKAHTFKK